ncbi:Calcium uniporter protein 2 protein [Thalictrum thalictroides]|uniref:Calcium uniporter protein 2 protein n=1 Tax=Thalictrum thalictroides TaxID=46969 RepID=A0A7J6VIE0_THATH|nr:Calcium uniporter protein 2 protein [Thalictrum thalictroides]
MQFSSFIGILFSFISSSSMALRRNLSQRLSQITQISSSSTLNHVTLTTQSPLSSKRITIPTDSSTKPNNNSSSVPSSGFFRRFLQKRELVQSPMSLPIGDKLIEKFKEIQLSRDITRLHLDGLFPPPPSPSETKLDGISIAQAKKILKLAQLETVKSTLRRIPKSSILYSEFVQICKETSGCDHQGLEFAKMLDESGSVIVIKDSVFLRPEQIAKAIEGVIPLPMARQCDPRTIQELERMEKEKFAIDKKAEALVRGELWCGLGFLVLQTAGFMRLTFWELSWDVMEPICFYVTSVYFMASYAFFLRTSQEPSFEGFFQSRFKAKQNRLMREQNFDLEKLKELRRACYPHSSQSASEFPTSNSEGSLICN